MSTPTPVVAGLVAVAAGAVAYVFLMPYLSGEKRAEKRRKSFATSKVSVDRADGVNRRDQIAKTLKDAEAQKDRAKVTLELRLQRAGLTWSTKKFYVASLISALVLGFTVLVLTGGPIVSLVAVFAGGFGAPRWALAHLKKRRLNAIVLELPNAIDVIVRGIRSGIPLGDCLRMIAREAKEPLRTEFKAVVDAQSIGMSVADAILKMHDRVPVTDVNFLSVVIGIQQKSGGNLSEALGNLSRVLRDRRKMAAKVKAMSMEAKASAAIIGALPVFVAAITYFTSPDYISLLWTTTVGKVLLLASAIWMSLGIFTMKKMINFDI